MAEFSAQEVLDEIERQAATYGIDPKLAQAFFHAENSARGYVEPTRKINGAVTSPKGARGVMQTMPSTEAALKKAGFLPKDWQFNPDDLPSQVQAGLSGLHEMRSRQKNRDDPYELAVMYNAGTVPWQNYRAGAMDKLPAETQQYLTKIGTALGGGRKDMTPQQMESYVGAPKGTPAPVNVGAGPAPGASRSGSTSSSVSVRTNSFDPAILAATMNEGFQLIKSGGSIDTAIGNINQAAVQRQMAEQEQLAAITERANAAGATTSATTAVEAQAAARRQQILTAAGINPDVANNMAQKAFDAIIQGTAVLEAQGAEIDARQAVGIFDNPLEWLINQTRLPGMVGQYNQQVRQQNRAIEAAQQLQGLSQTQISLSQGVDADLITKAGAAKVAETAARAQEEATQVRQAIAGNAVRDAVVGSQLAGQKFQTSVTLTELTKQVRSENQGMSERDAARAAEQIQLERVNKWLKMVGSTNQFDSATFKSLPTKTREDMITSAGTGRISNSLFDGVMAIQNYGNSRNMAAEGDAATVAWLQGTVAAAKAAVDKEFLLAENQAKITGKVLKKEEFLRQQLDKIQELYQAEALNMRAASDSNPLKLSYELLLKDPALSRNPVAQFVQQYGPSSPSPMFTKVDEKFIIDKFVADVGLGKMTSGQAAAAIADFYKQGTALQARATKYTLFGIDTPANGYTVDIPAPGMFDKSGVGGRIDLTNAAAVETFVIKNVAARAMGQLNPFPSLRLDITDPLVRNPIQQTETPTWFNRQAPLINPQGKP